MKPDSSNHNPDQTYIRSLVDAIPMPQVEIAEQIGSSLPMLQRYITTGKSHKPCPYLVQFALESLAESSEV